MAVLNVTVCDVCKDASKRANTWTVEGGGVRVVVDLCADDSADIQAFVDRFKSAKPDGAKPPRPKRPSQKMDALEATMDEIEAMKGKGRK